MHRGGFGCSVALGVGTAVLLASASSAWAFDASSYFPLKVGVSWTYDVERRMTISSGLERFERHMTGWREDEVLGPSRLSTAGTPVYKIHRRMALGDVGTTPIVRWDFVARVSSAKSYVRLHGNDSEAFERPMLLLGGDPSPTKVWLGLDDQLPMSELVAIEQLGAIQVKMDLLPRPVRRCLLSFGSLLRRGADAGAGVGSDAAADAGSDADPVSYRGHAPPFRIGDTLPL